MNTSSLQSAHSLRSLYFTRTLVQLLWAAGVLSTALSRPGIAAILLILYPLWDVVCTLYDLKTSQETDTSRTPQIINAALGCAAALGIALTIFSRPAYGIAILGAWALGAGLLQLTVGLLRRKRLGGQWAMILSGAQSTAAGAAFALGALSGKFHARDFGGYAVFGALYFLIAGILLSRKISRAAASNGDLAVRT